MSRKLGGQDDKDENVEGVIEALPAATSSTLTTVSTAPAATDQFMFTDDFKRLLVGLVQGDTLMTKAWKRVVDAFIDEGVKSGAMIVHGGADCVFEPEFGKDEEGQKEYEEWMRAFGDSQRERRRLVMRVIFLLNITKVGENACTLAANLIVLDIPEGVQSISRHAFSYCYSLTTVSFPKT
ncbi:hypothetical protein TL16_g10782 [Triparma laevis f. inornata]|uniref:Uncharacterized protein n=1 Tax=Triparma laevis f. inornata TaxID=1714386 RepID=A0A9W7BA92_9STRA|nr:hypothetical protein TL16_g10782 [Triparma laevis f. inornata]